ncbi:hypothetical protein [Desulfotomaculum copahuensis]|uniref:Uncharacterized protein n=1 Tax=Desulfotomaculum copahuensis TaxID=1838280 RepID=A0A1B7LC47_9FIRM|nr:hypothetical protein [Desulfotomaculum copahuensis]OAT80292.1 hypothetical protein A6M21_13990 [Desulfotomaculum copahuensis]
MSTRFAAILTEKFQLPAEESKLLGKTTRQLSRLERRLYFEKIKPRCREFKLFLQGEYALLNETERAGWREITAGSLLEKGGEPDLADSLVMDVAGRLEVYRRLRERAESEGVRLKAMTSFGGLSMVLFLVVVVTAAVLYLINH